MYVTRAQDMMVIALFAVQVYASPSRRKMDTKGEGEEMTYPHICFMVDNFDEVSVLLIISVSQPEHLPNR